MLLNDGQGMIIGGLINESDDVKQEKVPYFGNVKGVGFLFRRSEVTKKRTEIIVALVPRIQPYNCEYHDFEQGELVKASVPLTARPAVPDRSAVGPRAAGRQARVVPTDPQDITAREITIPTSDRSTSFRRRRCRSRIFVTIRLRRTGRIRLVQCRRDMSSRTIYRSRRSMNCVARKSLAINRKATRCSERADS